MDKYTFDNLISLFHNKYSNRSCYDINYVNDIITDKIVMLCLEKNIQLESADFLGLKNNDFLKFKKEIINSMISVYSKSSDEKIKARIKEIFNNIDFEVLDVVGNNLENVNVKSYTSLELKKIEFINTFKKQNTIVIDRIYSYMNNFFNQLKENNYQKAIKNNTKNLKNLLKEVDEYINKHFTGEEKENKKIEIRTFLTNMILDTHSKIIKNCANREIEKHKENTLKFIINNIGKDFIDIYNPKIDLNKINKLYFTLKQYVDNDFNYKMSDIDLNDANIFFRLEMCKERKNIVSVIGNIFNIETDVKNIKLLEENLMFFEIIMKSCFGYDKNSIEYYNLCEKAGALDLKMQAIPYWCNIMCGKTGINQEILENVKSRPYQDLSLFKFMIDNSDKGKKDSLTISYNKITIDNKTDISVNDVINVTEQDYINILNNNNRPTSAFFTILNNYNTETDKQNIENFLLDKLNELETNIQNSNAQDLINIYFMFRLKQEKQENEIIDMFSNSTTFNDIFYGFIDIINKYNDKYPENNLENIIFKKFEKELGIDEYMQNKRLLNNIENSKNIIDDKNKSNSFVKLHN